jgi:hypothetical protein
VETLNNAKTLCAIHGGRIASPRTEEENNAIMSILIQHGSHCLNMKSARQTDRALWLGFGRLKDKWYIVDDNKPTQEAGYGNWDKFTPVYPNLGCTYLQTDGYWSFRDKSSCDELELCTICMFEKVPVLSFKGGFCREFAPFDWNYYLSVNASYQIDGYTGYKDSNITNDNGKWELTGRIKEGIGISLNSNSHPIGKQNWTRYNRRCGIPRPEKTEFIFSQCEFGTEFTCRSGRCIPINKRCDRINDCNDESDEEDCVLVRIPENYKKIQAPEITSKNKSDPLPIKTQITLLRVDMIDTLTMLVGITVEIKMKWTDSRLQFANLNRNQNNPVARSIVNQLWIPLDKVLYTNSVIGKIYQDDVRRVFVIPISDPIPMGGFEDYDELMYAGANNPMEVSQRFRIEYNCEFNLQKFPFDRQKCDFIMMMDRSNSLLLVEDDPSIIYNGENKKGQFYIGPMIATTSSNEKETRFILSFFMDRIFNDQMINTFLPILLLWMLAYSTLFIKIENFSDRFMGTVTSLLVLAALLASINTSLPRTSYFKYIDLWFSWYLANIFSFVIFHILLNLDHSSPKHVASTIPNDLETIQLPLEIDIGVKTVRHSAEEYTKILENVSGKDHSTVRHSAEEYTEILENVSGKDHSTKRHSAEEYTKILEKVSGKDLSTKEGSTEYKYRMNKKAIIFCPVLILCFNVIYFLATTHVF